MINELAIVKKKILTVRTIGTSVISIGANYGLGAVSCPRSFSNSILPLYYKLEDLTLNLIQ